MTTRPETPRDADGAKLCAWCGGPIRQAGIGRSRDYCRRSCRQRAYEERRTLGRLALAAESRTPQPDRESSRDETPRPVPSRDETVDPQVGPTSMAPPNPELLEELGMTAAQFEQWRTAVLARPLALPFDDGEPDGTPHGTRGQGER